MASVIHLAVCYLSISVGHVPSSYGEIGHCEICPIESLCYLQQDQVPVEVGDELADDLFAAGRGPPSEEGSHEVYELLEVLLEGEAEGHLVAFCFGHEVGDHYVEGGRVVVGVDWAEGKCASFEGEL